MSPLWRSFQSRHNGTSITHAGDDDDDDDGAMALRGENLHSRFTTSLRLASLAWPKTIPCAGLKRYESALLPFAGS